jgi:hypothetical protein
MAPHGTTLGYESRDNKIYPILEKNAADKEMQILASRLQAGASSFVDAIMPMIAHFGPDNLLSNEWAKPFFRLVNEPTLEEAKLLGSITHSDSALESSRRLPLAVRLKPEVARQRGNEYKQAYDNAYWKKAFLLLNS